jgi:acetyl-CoA carboxylase biotin carboxylase subunit
MKKVLVANRGEIAVRVIRACRELSIPTVAVFSEADRAALHVQRADEAVCIGPPSPLESYLDAGAILRAARSTGADAVHPGYGFLAENASFAAACEREGLVFIGPPSDAIALMGDKIASRDRMSAAGVPVIPGAHGSAGDPASLLGAGRRLGFPIIVKAAGGGGGKGMRIVHSRDALADAIAAASREAESAFGNATVYLERYLKRPRHVEFQILADRHGNTLHLFERECSIQRRHQKLVEETPSTALTPELRETMGTAAVRVAQAAGYRGAGTVEFLLDDDGRFYYLEMNTRIQVEHPVTELVTGLDLVKWQIRIASGEPIAFAQGDLRQRGHAIECRIYAEDAARGFLPSSGKIVLLREPSGPGVRVDSGIYEGYAVPTHYDPILAKLIVWAEDRDAARRRMLAALEAYVCIGVETPIAFLIDVIGHPAFARGDTFTDFIPSHFPDWRPRGSPRARDEGTAGGEAGADDVPDEVLIAAAIADQQAAPPHAATGQRAAPSPWQTLGAWRLGGGGDGA